MKSSTSTFLYTILNMKELYKQKRQKEPQNKKCPVEYN